MRINVTLRCVHAAIFVVEKATRITYSECVFVALVIQRMRRIVLSSVACPALIYFPTSPHEWHGFRGKISLNIKCVFLFPVQLMSQTFLILIRIKRSVIINVYCSSRKHSRFLSGLNEILIFSTDFPKVLKYTIS